MANGHGGACIGAVQKKKPLADADTTSCGNGAIYRASNFVLAHIKENYNLCVMPDGTRVHKMTLVSNLTSPR